MDAKELNESDAYFDVRDWLADNTPVEVQTRRRATFAGPLLNQAENRHLDPSVRLIVTLAAARKLVLAGLVDVQVPVHFQSDTLAHLQHHPTLVDLNSFSPFYFEVGMKLAAGIGDQQLATALQAAAKARAANRTRMALAGTEGVDSRAEDVSDETFKKGLTHAEQILFERRAGAASLGGTLDKA